MLNARLMLAVALCAVAVLAASRSSAQSYPGVTVLQNPGGGTIAYAQMPQQRTLAGAAGKVLQYVQASFHGKPSVAHVLKSKDGNSMAIIFTVKASTQGQPDMEGLALIAVSANSPGRGAVLSDQSDRFGTTVRQMLDEMRTAAGGTSAAAGATTANSLPAPSVNATAAQSAPVTQLAAPASAATGKKPPQLPATLHTTPFPDGSGSIGLPDGWAISGAHAGNVIAKGPGDAALHFFYILNAYDPSYPRAKNTTPASGQLAIPYNSDLVTRYKAIVTQSAQQQHQPVPTIAILDSTSTTPQNGIVIANIGASGSAGPTTQWAQIQVNPLYSGLYSMTLYSVRLPQATSEKSQDLVGAIFKSYTVNNAVALNEAKTDHDNSNRAVAAQLGVNRSAFLASEKTFAADDNALLGNTVVRDQYFNGHATVSDGLADALTQADPSRFVEVPASQYVPGVDFIP